MTTVLNDPSTSQPDMIDPGLKKQLRRLFTVRPRVIRGSAIAAPTALQPINGRAVTGVTTLSVAPVASTWAEWQTWGWDNKWGLAIIIGLAVFLYYRYMYCREAPVVRDTTGPPIYTSDFHQTAISAPVSASNTARPAPITDGYSVRSPDTVQPLYAHLQPEARYDTVI